MDAGIVINLYEDEKIVLVIRRHWLAFLESILITAALLLVFVIGFFILNSRISTPATSALCLTNPQISDNLGKGALVIFSSIYLLATCAFFYISWLDYYLDIFVITNKRILRIEQLVLFGQNISETSLQHVQDVSSKVRGILYTVLNVGTVFIETAGDRSNFNFNFIKNPGEIAAEILELQKEMWGDEGFKEDISLEREKMKIEKMNTGDPLRKREEAEKARLAAIEELNRGEEAKKEPHAIVQRFMDMRDRFTKPKEEVGSTANISNTDSLENKDIPAPKPQPVINNYDKNQYSDGRKITPHGVIWQSEQEISEDILNTLNEMDG